MNELAPLGLTLALTLISVSLRAIHGCSGEAAEGHDVGKRESRGLSRNVQRE